MIPQGLPIYKYIYVINTVTLLYRELSFITGPLWWPAAGEFSPRASYVELWCFPIVVILYKLWNKQLNRRWFGTPWCSCGVTLMSDLSNWAMVDTQMSNDAHKTSTCLLISQPELRSRRNLEINQQNSRVNSLNLVWKSAWRWTLTPKDEIMIPSFICQNALIQ